VRSIIGRVRKEFIYEEICILSDAASGGTAICHRWWIEVQRGMRYLDHHRCFRAARSGDFKRRKHGKSP
jgi:hypothetical protein